MFGVLRTVARPWRWVRRARSLKDTVVTHLRQILDLERELRAEVRKLRAEVRELHRSSLLAAIHTIEEQRSTREELAQECARLERRLRALERHLDASGDDPPAEPPGTPA